MTRETQWIHCDNCAQDFEYRGDTLQCPYCDSWDTGAGLLKPICDMCEKPFEPDTDHQYTCQNCESQYYQAQEAMLAEKLRMFPHPDDEDTKPTLTIDPDDTQEVYMPSDFCVHKRNLLGRYIDEGGNSYDLYECVYCGMESKVYDWGDL